MNSEHILNFLHNCRSILSLHSFSNRKCLDLEVQRLWVFCLLINQSSIANFLISNKLVKLLHIHKFSNVLVRHHSDDDTTEKEYFRWHSSVLPRDITQVIAQIYTSQKLQVSNVSAAVDDGGLDYKVYFRAKISPFRGSFVLYYTIHKM